jgi:hypothetical protein
MPRISFADFRVNVPNGWDDVTDSLEGEDPPFTLARDDGFGALQFSLALYAGGKLPIPSTDDLLQMLETFAATQGLGELSSVVIESGPLLLAAATSLLDDSFIRAWQVSDGQNFALITYVCEPGHEDHEVADCEQIVRSLRFD